MGPRGKLAIAFIAAAAAVAAVVAESARADEPTTQPTATAVPGRDIMATVNGHPLYMADLLELLIRGPGPAYSGQLVREEIVRQEMIRLKLKVTGEEILDEAERILKIMVPQAKTAQERRQVLAQLLVQKQVSQEQWLRSIRLTARLRKLAEASVKITDKMLKAQFGNMYGQQRIVRHIELGSLDDARKALADARNGKDFKGMAFNRSLAQTAATGGLLPPIGPRTRGVPAAIMQAVMAMENKGELSDPVQVGARFHILKLEKIIAPRDVKFEDVKDKVVEAVKESLLRRHQKLILDQLEKKARVRYVNPILKRLSAKGQG